MYYCFRIPPYGARKVRATGTVFHAKQHFLKRPGQEARLCYQLEVILEPMPLFKESYRRALIGIFGFRF